MADKSSLNELCIWCRQPTIKCDQPNSLHRLMDAIFRTANEPNPITPPSMGEGNLWPSKGEGDDADDEADEGEEEDEDDEVGKVVTTDS